MVARVNTVAFLGVEVVEVDVQVQISPGLPAFSVVGLPDKAVAESRERVKSALHAIGLGLPAKRIVVNLAPADLLKEGSHFDLPIALGLLGGGDAKLLTAGALWAGPGLLMEFLFLTALAGGGMATVLWLRHRLSRAAAPAFLLSTPSDPDFAKQPMPYAVAVAAGALYVAFTNLGIG